MSLLSIAREQSRQRGYAYYTEKRVTSVVKKGPYSFAGTVRGSGEADYHVAIDLEHPRSSSCDCPFAAGRSRICKHMIALYFTVFPDEAEQYRVEIERRIALAELEEERALQREAAIEDYLSQMSKGELVSLASALLRLLPDWQYDQITDKLLNGEDGWDYEDDGEYEDGDWDYE